jgi:hypothetical protein
MDFKKIIKSWVTSYNPTDKQLELAESRHSICDTCPSKKIITEKLKIGIICGECGCPITKKIFSQTFNDCPLGKWEIVDSEFFPPIKKTTSII